MLSCFHDDFVVVELARVEKSSKETVDVIMSSGSMVPFHVVKMLQSESLLVE